MSRFFDGTDDLITCPVDDTFMTETGAITIVVWANAGALANTICRRTAGVGNVAFLYAATGRLRYFIGGATGFERQTADNSVATGLWQSYAVTHDGSTTAANCHIYINLVEPTYAVTTNGSGPSDNSTANLTIGNNAGLTSDLNGYLAYLQIWNRVLTTAELWKATYYPGSVPQNMRVFLPMTGMQTPEPDLSGNKNHGTITAAKPSNVNPFQLAKLNYLRTKTYIDPFPKMGRRRAYSVPAAGDLSSLLSDSVIGSDTFSSSIPVLLQTLTDNCIVSDTINPLIPTLLQTLADNITSSDVISPVIPVLYQTLLDNIIASDTFLGSIPIAGLLTALLTDNVNCSDAFNPLIPVLLQVLADNVTASDTLNPLIPTLLSNLNDSVIAADTLNPLIPVLFQTLVDNITVSDLLQHNSPAGRTFMIYDSGNGWISFTVEGTEIMRIKKDGTIDTHGAVNQSAF